MSIEKVWKSLMLGVPLALLVQHLYWKKVLHECLSSSGKEGLTMQCFISCTMLILVFCVLEEYLIFDKDYNWKEKFPLHTAWLALVIAYYFYARQMVDKYVLLPLEEDGWVRDWNTAGDLYGYTGIFVYGIYLLVLYALMRLVFICNKEIEK